MPKKVITKYRKIDPKMQEQLQFKFEEITRGYKLF
nr:MAG TPA: hypothetical protein [Caudoviricetes sp.]